jgi:hypothetical protein
MVVIRNEVCLSVVCVLSLCAVDTVPIRLIRLWIQLRFATDTLDTAAIWTLIGLRRCLDWIRSDRR